MFVKNIVGSTVIALGLLLSGCGGHANFTRSITSDEKQAENAAFLYGKFLIDSPQIAWIQDWYMSMGLVLNCTDGNSYVIKFLKRNSLQAIKIQPSTCDFDEILFTSDSGYIEKRKSIVPHRSELTTFRPGKAYYLGDFFAESTVSKGAFTRIYWKLKSSKDNFVATTEEAKRKFPVLMDISTENSTAMLMGPRLFVDSDF